MAILTLLKEPDERLRKLSLEVTSIDAYHKTLVADMLETMYHAGGIGLAAPQVNVHLRIIVMDISEKRNRPNYFINPVLLETTSEHSSYEEGCLSVPNGYAVVQRPKGVVLKFQDLEGTEKTMPFDELGATCVQHEIDHLNGILFFDHLSPLKKSLFRKRLIKRRPCR